MLVSPILNDLLEPVAKDIDHFFDEVDGAIAVAGCWSSRSSGRAFPVTSAIIRRAQLSYDLECLLGQGIWLTQLGDVGLLRIPGLPETMSMAMAGLPVRTVIDHPLLARQAYQISSSSMCPDGACAAYFSAPREELRY